MKKYFAIFLCVCAIIGVTALVSVHNTPATMAHALDNNISDMMNKIDTGDNLDLETKLSSNPYDYAKNNEYFNKIVAMGYPVLSLIEDHINTSPDNGLKEYLLAIAMEEIAKVDLKTDEAGNMYKWETGKGFVREWDNLLYRIPSSVSVILNSGQTNDAKIAALIKLGIPVVPYIIARFDSSNPDQQQVLTTVLNELLKDNKIASFNGKDISYAKGWIQNNAASFDDLKKYVDRKASKN